MTFAVILASAAGHISLAKLMKAQGCHQAVLVCACVVHEGCSYYQLLHASYYQPV